MKKILVILALIGLLISGHVSAAQWTIDDNYIGGGATKFQRKGGDVVSTAADEDIFNITGMTVNIDDNLNVTVGIKTDYIPGIAENGHDDTDYGDLFISIDGWNPNDEQPYYRNDTFSTSGTTWDYAFDTSSVDPNTGVGDIFSTDGNGAYLSNDAGDAGGTDGGTYSENPWPHNWYRRDQLVQYNPVEGQNPVDPVEGQKPTFTLGTSLISYSFNLGDLGLSAQAGYDLGFRWTMTCANDIIEGGVSVAPVPEPGTVMLLGLGLLGMGAVGRKKSKKI